MEAIPTRDVLENIRGKRSFTISRSTFPGSGAYGGHWTGRYTCGHAPVN